MKMHLLIYKSTLEYLRRLKCSLQPIDSSVYSGLTSSKLCPDAAIPVGLQIPISACAA